MSGAVARRGPAAKPRTRSGAWLVAVGLAALVPATASGQRPFGSVTGVVVAEPSDRPVAGALVRLPGGRRAYVDERGAFQLDSVESGTTWIAAVAPGCLVGFGRVTVVEGRDAAVRLEVPSGRALERAGAAEGLVGLSRAEMRQRGFRSVYEALRVIAPYMVAHITGEVGGERRLSNRSARTFVSNEPLVVLDGIRLTSVSVAALEDFNIEDLERIDVARGAAAAWRYGLGSASGVIILTTTRAGAEGPGPDLAACQVVFPDELPRE